MWSYILHYESRRFELPQPNDLQMKGADTLMDPLDTLEDFFVRYLLLGLQEIIRGQVYNES